MTIKHIKELTGKGPKNIYVKIIEDKVEIHFWLQKSPLEKYVCDELREGKCLVKDIYQDALQHRIKEIQNDLSVRFSQDLKFEGLCADIETDKYVITFIYD
jgi:uncharacterized protein YbcI